MAFFSALLKLAEAGATVIVSDVAEEEGRASVDAIRATSGVADFIKADLTVESEIAGLVEQSLSLHGRIDGAFNNAGLEQYAKPIHELSVGEWQRSIAVNLTSVFLCLKYQALAMIAQGGGSIVNTASSLGEIAIRDAAEYIAAKHGVIGLTRAAAADLGQHNIRVNAVLPGITLTPMVKRVTEDPRTAAMFRTLKERHYLGRFGEPGEIGAAVTWLMSDLSSFVHGTAFPVDGGFLAS